MLRWRNRHRTPDLGGQKIRISEAVDPSVRLSRFLKKTNKGPIVWMPASTGHSCQGVESNFAKVRRSIRPTAVSSFPSARKLDNPTRVAVDAKSQRCLPERSTAAPNEDLELQSVDATAITKKIPQLASVWITSVNPEQLPTKDGHWCVTRPQRLPQVLPTDSS